MKTRLLEDRREEIRHAPGQKGRCGNGEQLGPGVQAEKQEERDGYGDAHHDGAEQESQSTHARLLNHTYRASAVAAASVRSATRFSTRAWYSFSYDRTFFT